MALTARSVATGGSAAAGEKRTTVSRKAQRLVARISAARGNHEPTTESQQGEGYHRLPRRALLGLLTSAPLLAQNPEAAKAVQGLTAGRIPGW
jgi:hypothetical protein